MADNVTPVVLKVKDFVAREVLLVNYKFNQATDQEGQVSGIVRGGQITIRVKALNDGNPELLAWMIDPAAPHDLTVEFENTKDGSAMKTLKGTGCYCIHYKEYWADGEEHYEEILLSCQTLENGFLRPLFLLFLFVPLLEYIESEFLFTLIAKETFAVVVVLDTRQYTTGRTEIL